MDSEQVCRHDLSHHLWLLWSASDITMNPIHSENAINQTWSPANTTVAFILILNDEKVACISQECLKEILLLALYSLKTEWLFFTGKWMRVNVLPHCSFRPLESCRHRRTWMSLCNKDLGHFWLAYIRMLGHLQLVPNRWFYAFGLPWSSISAWND